MTVDTVKQSDYIDGFIRHLEGHVDKDVMEQVKAQARGYAGGRASGRSRRKRKEEADVVKRYDLGLPKTHPSVAFIYEPSVDGEFCGKCVYYISSRNYPLGECLLVAGQVLQAGYCSLYADIEPLFNPDMSARLEAADEAGTNIYLSADGEAAMHIAERQVAKRDEEGDDDFSSFVSFVKAFDEEEQTVMGIVLEPEKIDSQKDIASEGEIRASAHEYMLKSQRMYLQHKEHSNEVRIVESYLSPATFKIKSADGKNQTVLKGSWVMVVKVFDDGIWTAVKEGGFTGFSIRGTAERTEE